MPAPLPIRAALEWAASEIAAADPAAVRGQPAAGRSLFSTGCRIDSAFAERDWLPVYAEADPEAIALWRAALALPGEEWGPADAAGLLGPLAAFLDGSGADGAGRDWLRYARAVNVAALVTVRASLRRPPDPALSADLSLVAVVNRGGQPGGVRVDGGYRLRTIEGRKRRVLRRETEWLDGAACPLALDPGPWAVVQARAEYAAWWRGLAALARRFPSLRSRPVTGPPGPERPWQAGWPAGFAAMEAA